MRVLAFDACLGSVSVAAGSLAADGAWEHVAHDFARRSTGHAETLMPMMAAVMEAAGLAFEDLERVVVTVGPGGFTGVRAGIAAARALALATGATLTGISTLDALALDARAQMPADAGDLAVAVDARRGMVYFARYEAGCDHAEPRLVATAEATRLADKAAWFAGSGAALVAADAVAAGAACGEPHTDFEPQALSFAAFARSRPAEATVRPLYLRPPDAKAQTSFILPRAL